MAEKNQSQRQQFIEKAKNISKVNEGLKDQISYLTQISELAGKANKMSEKQFETAKDVLDKTKQIFQNRKNLTEEQIEQVDLHKLERKLIAEGLGDHTKIVEKLRQELSIQKQINNVVNTQAKLYQNIGNSVDSVIRSIPGIGGLLADAMGTGTLGKELSETFRTELAQGGGLGEFAKNAGGEFSGGFLTALFMRGEQSKAKKAVRNLFAGGMLSAFSLGVTLIGLTKLIGFGMQNGLESIGIKNTFKRLVAGSAFDGLREAFGNLGQADRSTLFSMRMNRFRFGVDEKDQAKILAAQINISGATKETALNIQRGLMKSAAMRGVLPADVLQDIANNTEMFAQFAKDGGQNIGEAAIKARQLGVSLDTVSKISDSVLDFQSSIDNELKASLLTGKQLNLNRARELAMMGDMAGLQDEIVKQIGTEEELQRMNVIQRKALAGALGITVSELNRLASGELEIKNSDMKQNTNAIRNLTAVLIAATGGLAGRLVGQGIGYAQVLTGFQRLGSKNANVGFTLFRDMQKFVTSGAPDSALPASIRKEGISANQARQFVGGKAALGVRGGWIGALLTALAVIVPSVVSMARSSKETSDNTKKSVSRELNFPMFTSEALAESRP